MMKTDSIPVQDKDCRCHSDDKAVKEMTEAYPPLVEALLDPDAYRHGDSPVELIETHVSYVFFVGDYVYKVKKPVNYGFLDFTSLEKRRRFCEQEVRLNRRLSPEVYLGVEEIREEDGRYSLEGPGRTVEYAVKMRRLPQERSMDNLLRQGRVSPDDIKRIAVRIARFHHCAARGPEITAHGDINAVLQNVEENFAQTRRFVGSVLSLDDYDELAAYSRAFVKASRHMFRRRMEEGRIRDCHGDLHTAHVFLRSPSADGESDGINIIDCIEFNERFRRSDVAEDIAFFAMDLDRHGRQDLSQLFVETYSLESGDWNVGELMDFFKSYRACVRGKVMSFMLDDPDLPDAARKDALESARAYFRLARSYVLAFPRPAVILFAGVTGTGKSTVALDLARRWAMAYISSDLTRKSLAQMDPKEHRYEPFMTGIYSSGFSELTYRAMRETAREHLVKGESVVLDGTFRHSEERTRMVELARELEAEAWVVECRLPEAEARRRLERRYEKGDSVSDGRWSLFRQQLAQWDDVSEVPPERHLILDTSDREEETMRSLLQALYQSILPTT